MIGRKKVSAMPRGRHRKGRSGGVARRKGSVRGWGGGETINGHSCGQTHNRGVRRG